ncbi:uncharacterized protein EI90DRAFT_3120894 [Cantharellus anzutake]|uniref:uncharacterized protein n=1 Tax=Cantharellus anzutake TaxID=1750568 RepID=UPI001907203E|nr:uncharacterized protein EI90DRAFT_3120894 [Cantharellus anzutake]KAF8335008.1 hypothetical protein EI90DRAFT_3120894 [Cantharellus anzutake]
MSVYGRLLHKVIMMMSMKCMKEVAGILPPEEAKVQPEEALINLSLHLIKELTKSQEAESSSKQHHTGFREEAPLQKPTVTKKPFIEGSQPSHRHNSGVPPKPSMYTGNIPALISTLAEDKKAPKYKPKKHPSVHQGLHPQHLPIIETNPELRALLSQATMWVDELLDQDSLVQQLHNSMDTVLKSSEETSKEVLRAYDLFLYEHNQTQNAARSIRALFLAMHANTLTANEYWYAERGLAALYADTARGGQLSLNSTFSTKLAMFSILNSGVGSPGFCKVRAQLIYYPLVVG